MRFSLLPTWSTRAVTDVMPEFLKKENIELLMLDFDNTIVPYTSDIPTKKVHEWLLMMKHSGIQMCVVTNSRNSRVPKFCAKYGLDVITFARKPFSNGIHKCLKRYKTLPQKALLVGDQIFTDTLGGNCAGMRTVLVNPVHNSRFLLKLRYVCELPFKYLARNRRLPK